MKELNDKQEAENSKLVQKLDKWNVEQHKTHPVFLWTIIINTYSTFVHTEICNIKI